MKYKWLHVSDLHSICKGIKTEVMRDALLDEIRDIVDDSPFSFVLITGDISNCNTGYDSAKELIHMIIDAANVSVSNVYLVPGNHDVDRNIPVNRQLIAKKYWDVGILDKDENKIIDEMVVGQGSFFKAYTNILGRTYPVDKLHFVENVDENLSIININTSWMCTDSHQEDGKLHIGLHKILDCLRDKKLQNPDIKLAIGHHRMSDLKPQVRSYLNSMFKSNGVDLYLGGHCHESNIVYDPVVDIEFCSCRQARADDDNYPAGFIIGNIDTENDQSTFLFYSWEPTLAKWTYDYTVSPAKHGKYYLKGKKFNHQSISSRDIVVDLKIFGWSLDHQALLLKKNLTDATVYKTSLKNIKPKTHEEWIVCLKEIISLYDAIVKNSQKQIHIFPIASIPLLTSFGYLMQNDSSNISIYQYIEDLSEWVLDEKNENIPIIVDHIKNNNKILAVAISVSSLVEDDDITQVMTSDFDLLRVGIEEPQLMKLNYRADVLRFKKILKSTLDSSYINYDEIHLFIAAPAGLSIEIGRIIRESMYPDTYVYNYNEKDKYTRILNLKTLKEL